MTITCIALDNDRMVVDTANESPTPQLSFAVSTTIWLLSSVTHVMVKVVLKTEAAENRSCHSTDNEKENKTEGNKKQKQKQKKK